MAFAKFQENLFRIDGEIAENHAILVNLTASIVRRHTGVQVYSGIYLERRYAVPAAGTRYELHELHSYTKQLQLSSIAPHQPARNVITQLSC